MYTESKYPQFEFYKSWRDKIRAIDDEDIRLAIYRAIDDYGLNGIEPTKLTGYALDFFNKEVRPNLDKQHKQYEKSRKCK